MAGVNRIADQARNGELPEVTVIQGQAVKDGSRTKDELCLSGWNNYLVRKFLKPDRIRKTVQLCEDIETREKFFRQVSYLYAYGQAQVSDVEASPVWQKAKARSDKKENKPTVMELWRLSNKKTPTKETE